eukprot:Blabericola_migrator_1__3917@NODE_2185_length_3156_cov_92_176433_g69_i3_p3_GENE_NODE_2185_length_3156_cov_92_176433_g69_i3NODE_2185_length_3156_cov_92_176433_g69_i3_p3_ORF_typecomplete_len212_score47_10SRP40_C/PF05022_12/3_7e03SRP40_C/PF05022_12/1_1e19OrfB_IS605/PF01385_19/4_1OrfB_IS605/PF01385_19/6_7e02_NODE_2185_length_3156_cov_92_176433_g69_i36711306
MGDKRKRSKETETPDGGTIGPAIHTALLSYLKNDLGLKKTVKYFIKETQGRVQTSGDKVNFSLLPLFNKIEAEYALEGKTKRRKTDGGSHSPEQSSSDEGINDSTVDSDGGKISNRTKLSKKQLKALKKDQEKSPGPLQRLDEKYWKTQAAVKDNSFWAKGGDGFASKAASDLIKVRGKDFRHEKAKKKRASWKGAGEIDLGVNSVMFDSD